MIEDIKKSVLAGIMISIGGCVNLACSVNDMAWVGALLFSVGLFTICEYGFNLYTGKVGYIANDFRDGKYIMKVLLILAINLIVTFAVGALLSTSFPEITEKARSLYATKLEQSPLRWVLSSVLCGILMFIAVDSWKRDTKLGVFLCVPTFILAGFDHSIANSFYNGLAIGECTFTFQNVLFIITVILGNAIGCMLVPLLSPKHKCTSNNV